MVRSESLVALPCGPIASANKRQAFQIQIVFTDTLVRLTGTPGAKHNIAAYR